MLILQPNEQAYRSLQEARAREQTSDTHRNRVRIN